ncbi:MAG: YggN family protein [Rhodanobacteraceae bacterium]|jgi:hypothetical protein|nr:YggN family protein [Rhodanobacteraceae bacterium]
MRLLPLLIAANALAVHAAAHAQDEFTAACQASSSYDLTVAADKLVFDRAAPAPRRLELSAGQLRADGAAVRLNTEDGDRLALFERELRELLPKVRAVAQRGVDLALQGARAEAAGLGLGADTRAELDRRLSAHGAELRRRIATSTSTHDWQGEAGARYVDAILADLAPLLAADLGEQAMTAALGGDPNAAAALRQRAALLDGRVEQRLRQRMQALRPQVQALCPAIHHLAELQDGVRGADGRALDLLEVAAARQAPAASGRVP